MNLGKAMIVINEPKFRKVIPFAKMVKVQYNGLISYLVIQQSKLVFPANKRDLKKKVLVSIKRKVSQIFYALKRKVCENI